jgi:hypothetical protein
MSKSTTITMTIEGMPELKAICRELPTRSVKKAFRAGFNAAGTPVARAMRRHAAKKSGLLRKSIRKKVKTYPNGSTICIVGPDRNVVGSYGVRKRGKHVGQTIKHRPAFISHLVDKGHGGPHPAPAHEFRDPAWRETKDKAEQIVKDKTIATLEAEGRKLGKS